MTDKPIGCVNCGLDDHDTKDCTRLPVVAAAKALCKHHAELCGVNADDQWTHYSEDFLADVRVVMPHLQADAQALLAEKDAAHIEELAQTGEQLMAQARTITEKDARIAEAVADASYYAARNEELRTHIRTDNTETLANALAEVERLNGLLSSQRLIIAMLGTCGMNIGNEREHLRAQLEQLQAAPAERRYSVEDLQRMALSAGFEYVRESDDHYVTGTADHAIDFIRDVIGVDVRLNQAPAARRYALKDDPRSAQELSLAGCNCVRFGEGNPHWPCRIHPAAMPAAPATADSDVREVK